MARGVGDIGILKGALFVPGLMNDLISTGQLDRDGLSESTEDWVKKIWSGRIYESEVLMQFDMKESKFYHWTEPYPELHRPRENRSEFMHSSAADEQSPAGRESRKRDEVDETAAEAELVDKGTGKHYVYHTVDKVDQHEIIKQFVIEEVLPSGLPMVKQWTADSDANFLDMNGVVERAIGATMKLVRAVMSRYNSPADMWEHAVNYVVWTHNRTVDSVRGIKTPEERVTGIVPDLSGARPFDTPCWYFVYRDERKTTGAVLKPR
ncbi:hypothetical protein B484DRAFT_404618, partial [Ochromonadaceae sp. CCMP2298]